MRAQIETHVDDAYLASGTHKGADGGLEAYDQGADFKSCGITVGRAVLNTTDGSDGLVTAVTEDSFTCTLSGGSNNTWSNGDTYEIYKTAAKGTFLSKTSVDRRFGRKVVRGDVLTPEGLLPEDVDLDEDTDEIFGPNQPSYNH